MNSCISQLAVLTIVAVLAGCSADASTSASEESALALIKASGCGKCHAVDQEKLGPSYKAIAKKYKQGDANASVATLTKHMTTAPHLKTDDYEGEHKNVRTTDKWEAENLARWILSR